MRKSSGAYDAARKNGWLNDICQHMKKRGNRMYRCVYSYEFIDNYAYVGLTYNIDIRQITRNSNNNDAVTNHINKTGLQPIRKQLTDYIPLNEAIKFEEFYVNEYRKNGFFILNRMKTGGIGGNVCIWTKENCKKEELIYNYRNDFKKYSSGAYRISLKEGWLDEICSHMKNKYNKWSFEKCKEVALKYSTISDFRKNAHGAYVIASNKGWINEICSHMLRKKKINNFWTKEKCINEAYKYKTINELRKNSNSAYVTIIKNKWLNEISFLLKYTHI